ncbi:MAG: hypothetical protein ACTHL8_00415 [Burkholderiaceae bacterium]
MRNWKRRAALALLAAAGLASLAGCGGDVYWGDGGWADFDVIAAVDGHRVHGFDAFPGDEQVVHAVVGDAVELDSSGWVDWTIAAGDGPDTSTHAGDTFQVDEVTVSETVVNSGQIALSLSATAPLAAPVTVTIYAISRDDPDQVARIDIVVSD